MTRRSLSAALAALILGAAPALAAGSGDHSHGHGDTDERIGAMQEMHAGHDHGHDFETFEHISEEDMHGTMDSLVGIGLVLPDIDSERGGALFMEKGCVVCHSVNGVGGKIGPAFDAADMPKPMNAFELAARMWRGAPAMVDMQEDLLGEMISLDGAELADITAFVHDAGAQKNFGAADIPDRYKELMP